MKINIRSEFSSDALGYRTYNFQEEYDAAARDVSASTLKQLFYELQPAVKKTEELMKKYVPYSDKVHIHLRDVIYESMALTNTQIKIEIGAPKYYAVWVEFGKVGGHYKSTPFFRRSVREGLGKLLPVSDLEKTIKVDLGGMTR